MSYLKFLIFIAFYAFVACGEDFYKILNIARDADTKQIKKAFRTLSVKYHPDKNQGNKENQEHFLKINKAYETLMDPEKRKTYDIYGEEGLDQQNNLMNQNKQKGPNARVDINVELEDLYNGSVKELSLQKNIVCTKCHGTGGKLGKTKQCNLCGGRGITLQDVDTGMGFTFKMQNTCHRCQGKGIIFAETCEHCRGRKVVKEDKKLRIEVEKGMKDGQNIVFERESEQHPDTIPGDLVITVRQNPHRFFHSRFGDDLHAALQLNFKEALLGYSKKITHLDKREFYVESDRPTQPFFVRKIDREGMPQHNYPSQKGDLFIKLNVRLPERLSEAEKELVRQLFE
jgi:DnaJ-class molecular chaperone